MNNDVLWLVRLGLDQGLFKLEHCVSVRKTLGDRVEIGDFAQQLIDDAHVDDIGALEKIAGLAMTKGQKGPPAGDPFEDNESTAPFVRPPPPAPTFEQKKAAAAASAGPVPEFAFDTIGMLDDAALAPASAASSAPPAATSRAISTCRPARGPSSARTASSCSSRTTSSPRTTPSASTPRCSPRGRKRPISRPRTTTTPSR